MKPNLKYELEALSVAHYINNILKEIKKTKDGYILIKSMEEEPDVVVPLLMQMGEMVLCCGDRKTVQILISEHYRTLKTLTDNGVDPKIMEESLEEEIQQCMKHIKFHVIKSHKQMEEISKLTNIHGLDFTINPDKLTEEPKRNQ